MSERWAPTQLRKFWPEAARAVGPGRPSLQQGIRHSFSTDALHRTGDTKTVADFLGHSRLSTTERYAQVRSDARIRMLRGGKQVESEKSNPLSSCVF